ncbi:hypothetical protein DXG01_004885, partial [Tephrocybe rancida]
WVHLYEIVQQDQQLNWFSLTTLEFHTDFCCDRHDDSVFDLADFLPGELYYGDPLADPNEAVKLKWPHVYRKKKDQYALEDRILTWLQSAATATDQTQAMYDILAFPQHQVLIRALFKTINTVSKMAAFLEETLKWEEEWGQSLFDVIEQYEGELMEAVVQEKSHRKKTKKA